MKIQLTETDPLNPLAGGTWIDSHAHFDSFDREGLVPTLMERAAGAGVVHVIAIGGSDEANARAVRLAGEWPGRILAVAGFDRDLAGKEPDMAELRALIATHPDRVAGIGESGLDYHYEPDTAPAQRRLFEAMLNLAAETTRPIVIHSRDAEDDTLEMLRAHLRNWKGDPERPGVLHCFTGNYRFARQLVDMGFMISFSGILGFRNADDLRDVARKLPLDRLLIETDAPYLAPPPHRGKTNEPALVFRVAETLAETQGIALQIVSEQTTANARILFRPVKENQHE